MEDPIVQASGIVLPFFANPAPFDWKAHLGTRHFIVGESGSGKTTFIRAILGLIEPLHGEIRVAGFRVFPSTSATRRHLAKTVGWIAQDAKGVLDPLWPIWKTVTEPLFIHGYIKGQKEAREAAKRMLKEVGLNEALMDRKPCELSGGQCQRVCIARALALRPQVIVADEPVSDLDPPLQIEILDLLDALQKRFHTTLILVSHSLSLARHFADFVTVFQNGRPVETGPVPRVLLSPQHEATMALIEAERALHLQNPPSESP